MPAFQSTFEELTQSWQLRLQETEAAESDQLTRLETCIHICEESLLQLRQWVTERTFPGKDWEIYFFKQVKPVIMARYIYYQKVYRLHIGYFKGSGMLEKKRLEHELQVIARYFSDNADLYAYYRMGYTHHDELYFVRGAYNWKICPEVNHFDTVFSTSCDGKLAELMAYELLLKYIDGMLNLSVKLIEPAAVTASRPAAASTLQCTASLTDVVELGYALQNCGFFNHGKASIKDIMTFMANEFKVDLRNFYHLFVRLRGRKNPTRFIDELKAGLLRHIESEDD
ncbi:RteC domain-containing protein [Niastella populi]|uniref:Tetracycline regulation of excision, RteC n=1 Tax=Niastella populi TaxID=550983 RepID=A0A1V9FKR0_9BACT|nr:RteC domain-containing protein [Niastella populi]OQP58932.1 hypothetical protein A4R26_22395 [Niastella populi]